MLKFIEGFCYIKYYLFGSYRFLIIIVNEIFGFRYYLYQVDGCMVWIVIRCNKFEIYIFKLFCL